MIRGSIWIVTASVLTTPSWSQGNYTPIVETVYTPPEVLVPHTAHKLTVFLPDQCPPEDSGLYPVVLYSPASMFAATEGGSGASLEAGLGEFPPLAFIDGGGSSGGGGPIISGQPLGPFGCVGSCPPPPSPAPAAPPTIPRGFLAQALATGWAVVTVGSTGWNSWPTCEQLNDCNTCNLGPDPNCGATGGCWDTNLWYAPGTPQWDDFSVFWGEKDFTWARQWVGANAATYGLDDDRVVVCGVSTGAIYASFLAFGPDRAWDGSHSAQARQDTRVAGLVAFEPNTWVKALGSYWGGVHWPSSDDEGSLCGAVGTGCYGSGVCYNRRATSLGSSEPVAPGVLEQSSISRWVREIEDPSERPTPAFIAAGDGLFLTTDFARDASTFRSDYDRSSGAAGALIEGDPLLSFTSAPELGLHDSWYAMNFALDLQMLDDTLGMPFHEQHSRLYLMDTHTWSHLPGSLSTTGLPPQSSEEVLGLDGTFVDQGVQSLENADLAPHVVDWMEQELGIQRTSGLAFRNPMLVGPTSVPNPNPPIYSTPSVRSGVPTQVQIDLSGAPGYESASVLVFGDPYAPGAELVLSGGQALLCAIDTFFFSLPFGTPDLDGLVTLTLPAASPACTTFCTQGILLDSQHVMPFGLTNAVDITVLP